MNRVTLPGCSIPPPRSSSVVALPPPQHTRQEYCAPSRPLRTLPCTSMPPLCTLNPTPTGSPHHPVPSLGRPGQAAPVNERAQRDIENEMHAAAAQEPPPAPPGGPWPAGVSEGALRAAKDVLKTMTVPHKALHAQGPLHGTCSAMTMVPAVP